MWGMVQGALHHRGLGTLLLGERLRLIRRQGAREVVLDTTQHARGFYERHGFKVVRHQPDSYGPGLDRYDMRLEIAPGLEAGDHQAHRPF